MNKSVAVTILEKQPKLVAVEMKGSVICNKKEAFKNFSKINWRKGNYY